MSYKSSLRILLVKILKCSHKQAIQWCKEGLVAIDGITILLADTIIEAHQEILFQDKIIRKGVLLHYVLFHKPHGYECTANRAIEHNMYELLPAEYQHLFPLGRLDKNSEGLLLLTNDGNIYANMVNSGGAVEKEYLVTTFYPITEELVNAFEQPFLLGTRYTLPAKFIKVTENQFKVILKEGINRQIRRICAKHDNQVERLVRIRFGHHSLGNLQVGTCSAIDGF